MMFQVLHETCTLTEYTSVQNFRSTSAIVSEKCVLQNNRQKLVTTDTHTQPFYSPFSGTTRVSWCQNRTSGLYGAEADTSTIRMGATPSGLSSAHLHHPPIFYTPDALPAREFNALTTRLPSNKAL